MRGVISRRNKTAARESYTRGPTAELILIRRGPFVLSSYSRGPCPSRALPRGPFRSFLPSPPLPPSAAATDSLPPSLLCNVRAGPVPRRSGPGPTKPAWNAVLRAHGVRSGRGYGVYGVSECAYAAVTSNRNQPRIFSDAFATVAGRRGLGGALILDYEKGKENFLWIGGRGRGGRYRGGTW